MTNYSALIARRGKLGTSSARKLARAFLAGFTIIMASQLAAATYYIDYNGGLDSNNGTSTNSSWKRCPGMVGFSGTYSHAVGDLFMFKGGITWPSNCFPLTVRFSGGAGANDQYIGNGTWYSGGTWTYPVFDGGNVQNGYSSGLIAGGTRSNLFLSKLKLVNVGSLTDGSGCAISASGNNVEISYCYLEPMSINAFFSSGAGGVGHLNFHHNVITNAGRLNISTGDNTYTDVQLHDNIMWGPDQYNPFAYHLDGFMLQSDSVGSYKFTNLRVFNNKFIGIWKHGGTAMIYTSSNPGTYGPQHYYIYNNLFCPENWTTTVQLVYGIRIGGGYVTAGNDDIRIYNNTFDFRAISPANPSTSSIMLMDTESNVSIQNNIFAGATRGIQLPTALKLSGALIIDYNIYFGQTTPAYLIDDDLHSIYGKTLAAVRPTYELNGYFADPLFMTLPTGDIAGSGNWHLQASSPAIHKGASLTNYFTTDLDGNPRGSAWTIGAYESRAATPPAQVRNLRDVTPGT